MSSKSKSIDLPGKIMKETSENLVSKNIFTIGVMSVMLKTYIFGAYP